MNPKTLSLIIFILAYVLFVILPARRTIVAVIGGALLIAAGALSLRDAFFAVNWNVMGIFVGTLVVADAFMQSRVPAYLAEIIVDRAKNTLWAVLFICVLTGAISAFVENVATVLIIAPVAFAIAKKLKISPVNIIIAIAISSNLQGTATLVGDPPSMLLGGYAGINFMEFFFYKGKPGIFFAVEFGTLASLFVLYYIFRKERQKTQIVEVEKVKSWVPTVILIGMILVLAASSFFDTGFSCIAGIVCMAAAAIIILWSKVVNKLSLLDGIRSLDWSTAFFLMGVFILVGGIVSTGWMETFAGFLASLVGNNVFVAYTAVVFVSVALSAFIDNVPYLAASMPIASSLAQRIGMDPSLFLFGLLIGASLGGNITPIGASANIVGCSLLRKEGYTVRFGEFVRIGLPFTLVAVTAAYLFIWLIWH